MTNQVELRGIGVVNATPLTANGKLNENEYIRHVQWLADAGVGFIQPHAAVGQGVLSSDEEYRRVLELTVKSVGDRVLVTAYAGRAGTDETIEAAQIAAETGAHAAFIIQPWYSKPDEEGLYQHFRSVASAVDIPLIIYNNPQRTGLSIPVHLIRRLVDEFDNFIALKQTDLSAVVDSFAALSDRISVSPYGDAELLWGLAMGATWSISYSANVIAPQWVKVFDTWMSGDLAGARELFYKYLPLVRATHLEPIPGPIKYMLNKTGWDFGPSRLPIHEVSAEHAQHIDRLIEMLHESQG